MAVDIVTAMQLFSIPYIILILPFHLRLPYNSGLAFKRKFLI